MKTKNLDGYNRIAHVWSDNNAIFLYNVYITSISNKVGRWFLLGHVSSGRRLCNFFRREIFENSFETMHCVKLWAKRENTIISLWAVIDFSSMWANIMTSLIIIELEIRDEKTELLAIAKGDWKYHSPKEWVIWIPNIYPLIQHFNYLLTKSHIHGHI